MAATKKKSAGKRRTPAGRKKKQVQTGPSMESEIFLWIVLAVSVVLLISNFGVGGSVGNAISSFFFGLVGLVCYPLPIFLFLGVAFVIANKRNPRAYRKMAGFVLLFLAVCLFLQLVTEGAVYERDFMAYYRVSAEYKTGGGLLGGALSRLLVQAFGTVGTYVITVIAMVISFVLITQKSMFDMIKKFSRKMYRRAVERKALRQEELKARQEEQAEKEQQQERRKKRKERTEDFLKETEVNEPEQEIKRKKEPKASRKKAKEQEVSGDILLDEPFVPENAFPIHRAEELVQDLEEIVTDKQELYECAVQYLKGYKQQEKIVRYYEDKLLPLYKLYNLQKAFEQAQNERVWLKSGGFLVIQQTEAFVCIDVNTGKCTSKKDMQETFRKINLEAAKEIAWQLRLRNLSGIILIDFINLERAEDKEELMQTLQKYLWQDSIKGTVVDMTELNIVEVTRKKVKKSLAEELKELL